MAPLAGEARAGTLTVRFPSLFDRYLARRYLVGTVPVLLVLLILFSFLTLTDELEDVGTGAYTTFDAFSVVLYTMPRRIVDLMPVTMLLGGLFGLGAMANHQELMAARAIGMSRPRLGRPVLVLAIAVAVVVIAVQSLVVPRAEREAGEIRARTLQDAGSSGRQHGGSEFWTRSGSRYVRINEVRYGQLLSDVEIHELDAAGRLKELVQAEMASIQEPGDWRLDNVTVTRLAGWSVLEERFDTLEWRGLLNREQAEVLMLPLEALAPLELLRLIGIQRANGLSDHQHRLVLWQQFSIPVALVGMALLSLPLLLGSVRVMSAGTRVVIGGFIGIVFYLAQQLALHVAGLFTLSPAALIMGPAVALLAVGVWMQFPGRWRRRRSAA